MSDFCKRRPVPGDILGAACSNCGHSTALHVGVEHCPVCELVDMAKRFRESESAPVSITLSVDAHKLTDAEWTQLLERLRIRNRITPAQMRY